MVKTLEDLSVSSACRQLLTLHGPQLAKENLSATMKARLLRSCIAPEFFVTEFHDRIYPKLKVIGSFFVTVERYVDKFYIKCTFEDIRSKIPTTYVAKIFEQFFDLSFFILEEDQTSIILKSDEIKREENAFRSTSADVYVAHFFSKHASFGVGRGEKLTFDFSS
jgi:hypothetical protein